jgi:hypothetical protein
MWDPTGAVFADAAAHRLRTPAIGANARRVFLNVFRKPFRGLTAARLELRRRGSNVVDLRPRRRP